MSAGSSTWTTEDIPDLSGTTVVLTGITGGLGTEAAYQLAHHGARIIATGRDLEKVEEALTALRHGVHDLDATAVRIDLADLVSVRDGAQEIAARVETLDILLNNAGIMAAPYRTSAQGFELQMATNHLGHFALTAHLWPTLVASRARVVSVSSLMHSFARGIDLRTLQPYADLGRYDRWKAYSQSKLANLLFMRELDRRVRRAGVDVTSVAAHPGYALTHLQQSGLSLGGRSFQGVMVHQVSRAVGQSAAAGAWPLERAATEPGLAGGSYVGPSSLRQMRGRPRLVGMTATARDPRLAADLWAASEAAAGLTFDAR
ncbi:oxidoreductase [Mumia zhuanghuii]|uniref:SDR family NAD(P)-dependent oxidoreductase n=1 Tax=Mumia zhuanghuii TaxID=2585211 RepID=A0A5C4MML3_9ACTN|nr:oxidoreductase [Mumia zhuanghuii]TNC47040.1 SDR family NAD(P)-dependent oxidoreductase [Mumia zhuanghuii]TNC47266.1 SDR family NAD(P)-dependent oxidoreductase [Mumia zhuanghuii]